MKEFGFNWTWLCLKCKITINAVLKHNLRTNTHQKWGELWSNNDKTKDEENVCLIFTKYSRLVFFCNVKQYLQELPVLAVMKQAFLFFLSVISHYCLFSCLNQTSLRLHASEDKTVRRWVKQIRLMCEQEQCDHSQRFTARNWLLMSWNAAGPHAFVHHQPSGVPPSPPPSLATCLLSRVTNLRETH